MTTSEIWVVAEVRGGALTRVTSQVVGAARRIADEKGLGTAAVLIGGAAERAAELAALAGTAIRVSGAGLDPYEASRHLEALAALVESRGRPVAILSGASAAGLELMPALAARLGAGYAGSCVDLRWEGDEIAIRRPVFGGRVYEDVAFCSGPAVATFRPGAFPPAEALGSPGAVEEIAAPPPSGGPEVVEQSGGAEGRLDLSEASRVVAGGRGMGSAEGFGLVEDLADALGAAVGASRSVVDAGWRPHDEQVGKSGRTVSPELYVACGISGAIHHTLGMNTSKTVVAINTDPDALIFRSADLGIVGDVGQILPALTESIREAGGEG